MRRIWEAYEYAQSFLRHTSRLLDKEPPNKLLISTRCGVRFFYAGLNEVWRKNPRLYLYKEGRPSKPQTLTANVRVEAASCGVLDLLCPRIQIQQGLGLRVQNAGPQG